MKKILSLFLVLGLCFSLVGCSGSDEDKKVSEAYLTESEISDMYSNPEKYVGRKVKLSGVVFTAPDTDGDSMGFQIWGDPKNSDLNTVIYAKKSEKINIDDYIVIEGIVTEKFEGENAYGGIIEAPAINATKIEKVDAQDILAPTTKEVTPSGLSINQHNVIVTVEKIQFAKEETRVFIKVENNSGSTFSFYSFNTKIVQDGTQYDYESNYNIDYKEVNSEILNGVSSDGILTFPAISEKSFDLYVEGYSDNYDLEFNDYIFNIVIE